jgi:penicillin amidase
MIYLLVTFFVAHLWSQTEFSCTTTYDELNIPHVTTQSTEEFYYCFGLHHGRDRAWEIDYFRRAAQGRNAEVLGFSQLKSDLMMRLLDLPSEVEKMWLKFPEDKKKILEFYARGVNKGFETGKKSKEFIDLNYAPEEWKPQDSILVIYLQSFDQTRKTFFRDYEEELYKEKWGDKTTRLFDEDKVPWLNTILKDGEYKKREEIVKTSSYRSNKVKLWNDFPSTFGIESGSNNWAVSAKKSKSGVAILANDPHLDLKTPMFWYWISIKSPTMHVIGGSVPGVPIVASGTNGKVAWGLTNSYLNSADAVFVNDVKDDQVETIRPTVYIKWWIFKLPFFFKSFEKLKTGERILPLETKSKDKLVLKWSGFSMEPSEISSLFDIFSSQDVSEMDRHLSRVGVPSWNYVFADTKGDIGYRLVGRTYKHTEKIPLGIPTMSYEEFKKESFLDSSEHPQILKPKRDYVYTANNRHWPTDAHFYGGRGYSYSFRGFRIDELLKEKQDVESYKKIQCDRQIVDARFFIPKFQKHLAAPVFNNWDFSSSDSSIAPPVYRRLMDLLMEKWKVNEYALFNFLDELSNAEIEELKEIYEQALSEVNGRTWGQFHVVNFEHLSKNTDWKFSPEIPGIGDTHSVDPGTSKWNSDRNLYEQFSGASKRMIIELHKTPKIWLSLPGINRFYDSRKDDAPWRDWKDCQYREVTF